MKRRALKVLEENKIPWSQYLFNLFIYVRDYCMQLYNLRAPTLYTYYSWNATKESQYRTGERAEL